MTYAAPLKVTIRLTVYAKDPETGEEERPRHQGAGSLLRRNSADDGQRHVHHQRHRARDRFAVAPLARACSSSAFRRRAISSARSFPTAEAGWSSSTTTRTCCTSASTASANSTARCSCAPSGSRPTSRFCARSTASARSPSRTRSCYWNVDDGLTGLKLSHAITTKGGETVVGAGQENHLLAVQGNPEGQDPAGGSGAQRSGRRLRRRRCRRHVDRRSADRRQQELTTTVIAKLIEAGIESFEIFFPERDDVGTVISATIRKDAVKTQNEALIEIYRKLRPGDPPTLDTATQLFQGMFFDPRKYDFSRVGRMKFNIKLFDKGRMPRRSTSARSIREDFRATIKYLLKLRKGIGAVDDIDHLGNRRVRAVGELLENQFRIGLVRMERAIKEKMSVYQEMSTAMPHDLVNAKPVMAAIREFFGSSQLSQFMDQTNPLSEITHKRRLSALGPGGLSPRARRIRSARRAPHALRPHLPHRNAGRSEHRADFVAFLLCAHQRVRLHREPVPQGDQGRGDRRSQDPESRRHRLQSRRHRAARRRWRRPTAT